MNTKSAELGIPSNDDYNRQTVCCNGRRNTSDRTSNALTLHMTSRHSSLIFMQATKFLVIFDPSFHVSKVMSDLCLI